ncbi:hypothetical protein [Hymenobacter terrenus]|uniref:hypothetical protein n=1 Tax=Hymenobacter terrenus TaxID=1629124 RepID=UPI0006193BE8|nr:hypothetical protein [Hymenobacter terrenus]
MKSTLFLLLLSGALATSAAAQTGGWDTGGWDAPKKKTTKKTTTTGSQTRAGGQQAAPQNDGRTVSPYPSEPAQPDPNPGNTASTPPDNSFVPGATSGSTQGGNDRQGMSVAPGTPVMLQSGRSVLENDAAAARERRRLRTERLKAAAAKPTLVGAEGATMSGGDQAGAAPAATTNAGAAAAGTSAAGGMNAATGNAEQPIGVSTKTGSATQATPPKKSVKKAPAAPSGW